MCGIFCILNGEKNNEQFYKEQFIKGVNRGPEDSKFISFHNVLQSFKSNVQIKITEMKLFVLSLH
jgi:asparagine synthetase B (glutamine-hydrolysing)